MRSRVGEEVGGDERRALGKSVGGRVLLRAPHQRRAAFHADGVRAEARDRQREVAEAAEEVGDALARLRREQRHRAPHEHAVDARS